ncbi:hypothetical protein Tco_1029333 [Tanacetum coccineum]|uniref:Uncharacterized protein n=1 Tax=Tanacetum coccineum TaxID=301880 RepID=A0ABQ5G4W3_9ASTR
MSSTSTNFNIEKHDGFDVQKQEGSKQVGLKQLGHSVERGAHGVLVEKCVWLKVELQRDQENRKSKVKLEAKVKPSIMVQYIVQGGHWFECPTLDEDAEYR